MSDKGEIHQKKENKKRKIRKNMEEFIYMQKISKRNISEINKK